MEEVEPTDGADTTSEDAEVTGEVQAVSDVDVDELPSEPAEAVKIGHVIGYSMPEDELHVPSSGDPLGRSDEELLALGVEGDGMPVGILVVTGVGILAFLVAVFLGVGSLFGGVARHTEQTSAWAGSDPRLGALQEHAASALSEPAVIEVEGGPTEYRVPIDEAMRIIEADQSLLGGHPLGDAPEPPPTAELPSHPVPAGAHLGTGGSGSAVAAPPELQLRLVAPEVTGPADSLQLVPIEPGTVPTEPAAGAGH